MCVKVQKIAFYSFLLTCAYKFSKCGAVPYKKNLSSSSASSAAWQRALFSSFSSAALLGAAVFHSKLQGNLFSAAICISRKPSFSSFYAVLRVNTRPIYRYTPLNMFGVPLICYSRYICCV